LGMSYKKDIDDLRESGSLDILKKLLKRKIKMIEWSDPHIKNPIKISNFRYNKKSIILNPKTLKSFDLVILMTDHDKFNYKMIYKNSKCIIDCRGRYSVDKKVIRA